MLLMPKRVKFRKTQRGRIKGNATRCNTVAFGEYGLQALEGGWLKAASIEAVRVVVNHFLAREGKLWMRIFPHKSVTSTPEETRMGKGKGEVEYWCAVIKPGTMLFELGGISQELARQAFTRAAHKLPLKVRFVVRRTHA
jgi:large subunit ribosomal protein L16